MARVTVEDSLEKLNNRFALVLLVAKRAKQLLKGATPTLTSSKDNKYIVTSLREVASGNISFEVSHDDAAFTKDIEADLQR